MDFFFLKKKIMAYLKSSDLSISIQNPWKITEQITYK